MSDCYVAQIFGRVSDLRLSLWLKQLYDLNSIWWWCEKLYEMYIVTHFLILQENLIKKKCIPRFVEIQFFLRIFKRFLPNSRKEMIQSIWTTAKSRSNIDFEFLTSLHGGYIPAICQVMGSKSSLLGHEQL